MQNIDWSVPGSRGRTVLTQAAYEGIEYPIKPSKHGSAVKVQQLRDPYIYEEGSRTFLFYSTAGEMGIAMAELTIEMKPL